MVSLEKKLSPTSFSSTGEHLCVVAMTSYTLRLMLEDLWDQVTNNYTNKSVESKSMIKLLLLST